MGGVEGSTFSIQYRFYFSNGNSKEFSLEFEKPSLKLLNRPKSTLPEWTLLTHHQCSNCPLSAGRHRYCPVAVSLVDVVEAFSDGSSHEEVDAEVTTHNRKYCARVSNTHAVGSLLGILMATSGCPIMDRLRPMVLTHLPFPTTEESVYRSISMYLMAQYFRFKNGQSADWDLTKIGEFFEEIQTVNQSFVKRLTSFVQRDVSLNAVVLLNCFATAARRMIEKERFDEVEQMFEAHFRGEPVF